MTRPDGCLVLEDGSVFRGQRMGDLGAGWGEVVFNTSMTGYQEMLTDPSYAGQILVLTYPLIGNYGVIPATDESARIQVRGLVVRSDCDRPSHPLGGVTVDAYLRSQGVPGLAGVDTRAITRRIRERGVMQGLIVEPGEVDQAKARLADLPQYDSQDFIEVGTREPYGWDGAPSGLEGVGDGPHIVVLDEGLKYNILRMLRARGCRVTAAPPATDAADVLAMRPDGVLLSPGPGDPQLRDRQVRTASGLLGRTPLMGICLGHQVIGRALGAETFKLKFGHRGGNHPVKDLITGAVAITAQNHGYALDPDGLRGGARVSHVNLHDDTVEGLTHSEYPLVSIQYHSEASPGPLDNAHLVRPLPGPGARGDVVSGDVTYRRASADDAASIAAVIGEVVSGPQPVGLDRAFSAGEVRMWIGRLGESGLILLAEDGGRALGFGALDFDTQAPETASLGVWLLSEARRQGIGTRLAEGLLAHARAGGFRRVVGRLPNNNEAALSFLSSIGGLVPIINSMSPAGADEPELRFELPL